MNEEDLNTFLEQLEELEAQITENLRDLHVEDDPVAHFLEKMSIEAIHVVDQQARIFWGGSQ